MHLMGHPNSSQMIYDLQQESKNFLKLPDMTRMDVMESLADTITSFNPVHHFNRFLV